MTNLAILIPTHRLDLNSNEKKTLNKLTENYNKEHIYFILPEKIKNTQKTFHINCSYFDDYYFSSHRNYNKLLLSKEFFERFLNYKKILIYQLDCYLIKNFDYLDMFSEYDFVGSPHINKKKKNFNGILNGGLSLRSVKPSLEVLNSSSIYLSYITILSLIRYFRSLNRLKHFMTFIFKICNLFLKKLFNKKSEAKFNAIFLEIFPYYFNEDIFWSLFSVMYKKNFNVIDPKLAVKFGFDKDPEELFILNNKKLPFGCHNCWSEENNKFWKKYF